MVGFGLLETLYELFEAFFLLQSDFGAEGEPSWTVETQFTVRLQIRVILPALHCILCNLLTFTFQIVAIKGFSLETQMKDEKPSRATHQSSTKLLQHLKSLPHMFSVVHGRGSEQTSFHQQKMQYFTLKSHNLCTKTSNLQIPKYAHLLEPGTASPGHKVSIPSI